MAERVKEELAALLKGTPIVTAEVDDGLDIDELVNKLSDVVKAARVAWPHFVAVYGSLIALFAALGWDFLTPPKVEPQQIAAAVREYAAEVPNQLLTVSGVPKSRSAAQAAPTDPQPPGAAAVGAKLPASIDIRGPAEAALGDLVVLEAVGQYDAAKWFLGNSPKSFLPVEGGSKVVFASGTPGEYRFFAVGASVEAGNVSLDDATFTVRIGHPGPDPNPNPGPTPNPGPQPNPNPTPSPTIPDDAFGNVGRLTFDTVAKFSPSARSKAPATGALYCEASSRLAGDGDPARLFVNVSEAMAWLKQERSATWSSDAAEWQKFVDTISAPWNERWPMDKATAAEFLDAVGKALKAVKS